MSYRRVIEIAAMHLANSDGHGDLDIRDLCERAKGTVKDDPRMAEACIDYAVSLAFEKMVQKANKANATDQGMLPGINGLSTRFPVMRNGRRKFVKLDDMTREECLAKEHQLRSPAESQIGNANRMKKHILRKFGQNLSS